MFSRGTQAEKNIRKNQFNFCLFLRTTLVPNENKCLAITLYSIAYNISSRTAMDSLMRGGTTAEIVAVGKALLPGQLFEFD